MKFKTWFTEIQNNQQIIDISFFINGKCNLSCPTCYAKNIQADIKIDLDNWKKFLKQAINTDAIRIVSIVGKEPFLTATETIDILEWLEQFPQVNKGVISNLHLMKPKIAKKLAKLKNFFIDVSLDGVPKIHNGLRGQNAWQKSINGIKILQNAGVNNIFASCMLLPQNLAYYFGELVSLCVTQNLKKFAIFPYCSLDKKDPLCILPEDYCWFIEKIMTPGYLKTNGVEIIVKNDYLNPEIMYAAIKKFIKINKLEEDENGVLYNLYEVKGNKFYFNFLPFPIDFVSAIRINYDGNAVIMRDMMRPNLEKYAIGHISEGYEAIKQKLFTSKKVEKFYKDYFDKYLK